MKLKIAILMLLCSQQMLGGNYCLQSKLPKGIECEHQDLNYALSKTAVELSSKLDTKLVGFDPIPIKEADLNTAYFTPIVLNISGQLVDKNSMGYEPIEYVDADLKFNIVYETFVSVTYEPWNKVWLVDHFMFEYITDKYRNAFAMFTLKIDIL